MITIVGSESGPSEKQRDFFVQLRGSREKLQERSRRFIQARADASLNVEKLHVYAVEIGSDEDCDQHRFTIEFSDIHADIIHRVGFNAGEPVDYGFDD